MPVGLADPSSSVLGGRVGPTAGRSVALCCRTCLDRAEPPHARQHESVREPGKKISNLLVGVLCGSGSVKILRDNRGSPMEAGSTNVSRIRNLVVW